MKRTSRVISTMAALLLAVSLAAPAQAGLLAKSPNLNAGGFPVWLQDQNSLGLQGCLDGTLGPLGADPPKCFLPNQVPGVIDQPGFDPIGPKVFPGNWPAENMYYLATTADMALPNGVAANVEFAVEATIDPALNNPMFHRIRMMFLPNTAAGAGTYTVVHPWGTTVFTAGLQESPFGVGGARGRATADVNVGIPTDLPLPYDGIMGNDPLFAMSHFPASVPTPPAINPPGFLGDCATFLPITAGPNGNTVQIIDPNGVIIAQTNLFSLCAQKIGMDVQPGFNHDFVAVNMNAIPVVPTIKTITFTNTTALPITFPILTALNAPPVMTGADPLDLLALDAADFTIAPPTQPVAPAPALADCAGAILAAADAAAVPPVAAGICGFDIVFKPVSRAKGVRVANIHLDLGPTVDLPPVTLKLSGTAVVTVTAPASVTLGTAAGLPAGTAPAGTAVTFTVTPINSKFKVRDVLDGTLDGTTPVAGPLFTINTAAVDHTVTASFMPSGNLTGSGTPGVADALKALRITVGLDTPTDEDKLAMDVAPLGADGRPAGDQLQDLKDVLLILRRALSVVTW